MKLSSLTTIILDDILTKLMHFLDCLSVVIQYYKNYYLIIKIEKDVVIVQAILFDINDTLL